MPSKPLHLPLQRQLTLYSPTLYEKITPNFHHSIRSIKVECLISLQKASLNCQFHIHIPQDIADKIRWQPFSAQNVHFKDYLWQDSCLECFIGKTDVSEYVEINASPVGNYAVYHFERYRTPDCIPPVPLEHGEIKRKKGQINWIADTQEKQNQSYHRQFSFDLSQLPNQLIDFHLIHPCVILYFDNQPLFFAPQHAIPADFHQQNFWIEL